MKLRSLVTGVAILALCASAAQAVTPTHHPQHRNNRLARSNAMNAPAQPIAYSKLDAYLKASPSEREKGNWGLGASTASTAPTGPGANASATAPAASAPTTPPAAEAAPSSGAPSGSTSATAPGAEAAPTPGPNGPQQNSQPPTTNNPNGATPPNSTTTAPPNGGN